MKLYGLGNKTIAMILSGTLLNFSLIHANVNAATRTADTPAITTLQEAFQNDASRIIDEKDPQLIAAVDAAVQFWYRYLGELKGHDLSTVDSSTGKVDFRKPETVSWFITKFHKFAQDSKFQDLLKDPGMVKLFEDFQALITAEVGTEVGTSGSSSFPPNFNRKACVSIEDKLKTSSFACY